MQFAAVDSSLDIARDPPGTSHGNQLDGMSSPISILSDEVVGTPLRPPAADVSTASSEAILVASSVPRRQNV